MAVLLVLGACLLCVGLLIGRAWYYWHARVSHGTVACRLATTSMLEQRQLLQVVLAQYVQSVSQLQ